MKTSFNKQEYGDASVEFMEKLGNWTFPGATLYYRDVELGESTILKYKVGEIVCSPAFVDVSGFAGRPVKSCRFIIASSKAAPIYTLKYADPNAERCRLHTINANSYFKVLDIYRKSGVTQIFLLHIPAKGIEIFRHSVWNLSGSNIEEQFIERARASLDQKLEMPPASELEEKNWIFRTNFPIGINMGNRFFSLEPDLEIFKQPDMADYYRAIAKMTEDNELNVLPESELDATPHHYSKAFEYLKMAAENDNNAEDQYNLAVLYANGEETERNLLLSAYWFRKAGEKDFHDAQTKKTQITCLHFIENITRWSESELFEAALEYYKVVYGMENAVENANSLIDAISSYFINENENKDYTCGLKCFRAMAEFGGSYNAMYNIGLCNLNGWGTSEKHPAALYWFDKAADCGNEEAKEHRDGLINVYMQSVGAEGTKNLFELLSLWCSIGMPEVTHDEVKSTYWKAKADELNKDILSDKANEKTYYEVWGNDTFAKETYFCGRYEDKEEAKKALADARQDALSQTESLRDTFWMVETTMGKIKERERLENERRERIYKRWHYDDDRLRNHVILLVKRLAEVVDMDKRGFIKEKKTFFQENNPHEEDCYIYVALEYYKGERGNAVGTVIKFRDGGSSYHTCVLVDVYEVTPSEELYSKLIKVFEKTIRDEMLDCL